MKIYEGKIWIDNYALPQSYTVILSDDKQKVESDTNKIRDILNSIPVLPTANYLLLGRMVPENLINIILSAGESRSFGFDIRSEVKEHSLDINYLDNFIEYSKKLTELIDKVSKMPENVAETEYRKL